MVPPAVRVNYRAEGQRLQARVLSTVNPASAHPLRRRHTNVLAPLARISFSTVALLLASLTACQSGSHDASNPTRSSAPLFSYTTDTELALGEGEAVIARASGRIAEFASPKFTLDGRFAFVTTVPSPDGAPQGDSDGSVKKNAVLFIDSLSRKSSTIECDCLDAAPIGGSRIAWLDESGSYFEVDLAGEAASKRISPFPLPQPSVPDIPFGAPSIRAHVADRTVFTLFWDGTRSEQLFIRHADGTTKAPEVYGRKFLFVAASEKSALGGPMLAVTGGGSIGACHTSAGDVSLIDPATGAVQATDFPQEVSSDLGGSLAHDLWWGADGQLYVTVETWSCNDDDKKWQEVPPSLWRLNGATWERVVEAPMTSARQLSSTSTAMVAGESLFIVTSDAIKEIARGVRMLTVPPAQDVNPELRLRFHNNGIR